MSFSETIFLFFVALLIFGPKKLPEIGRQVGKILNDFRRASNEFKAQIEAEISKADLEQRQSQSKSWQDKPKNTIMLPTAPPQGTVSADSTALTVPATPVLETPATEEIALTPAAEETSMAKAPDA
jgi:sec-independent protein translocase protein TatB